ncbi:hypothetical protein DFP72DRAFT_1089783 [Ephemerocybe angulata]|uniref:F-box domain-containing protein n=1 Tax=Ephemerocybe angulata TaxID=980116 RepID=A0A8H6I8Y6_9AGAR|nr:hypothetical protein DFP72DRAFT_1089783 [Tulosesus angulatus]
MPQPASPSIDERFTHLLNGKYPLEPHEVASIQDAIETETLAITKLELAISKLQQEVTEHESKRKAYESFLSPLRRGLLPQEILGEIFGFALGLPGKLTRNSNELKRLCLVCKSWRHAALARPALWARVSLHARTEHPPDMEKVRGWMQRSGTVPKKLAIRVSGDHCTDDFRGRACPLAFQGLAAFLADGPALDELSLKGQSDKCLEQLIDLVKHDQLNRNTPVQPWGTIRSLTLGMVKFQSSGTQSSWRILDDLPPLTSLSLTFPNLLWHSNELLPNRPLPFASLTSLTLRCDWPAVWILRNLENSNNLEDLVLDSHQVFRGDEDTFAQAKPILLPKLRTLHFRHMISFSFDTQILQRLRMPSLERIDLGFNADESEIDRFPELDSSRQNLYQDIKAMTQGVNCVSSLQTLRLGEEFGISSAGLLRILKLLPSLSGIVDFNINWLPTHPSGQRGTGIVDFNIDNVATDPDLFERAGCTKSLLPRLRTLEINDGYGDFDPADVCAYLIKRKDSATEEAPDYFEAFIMSTAFDDPHNADESAEKLRRRGVRVDIDI